MKNQIYIMVGIVVIIFCITFYWWGLRPNSIKKDCYTRAETYEQLEIESDDGIREIDRKMIPENAEQAKILQDKISRTRDYDKLFDDYYNTCLMQNGINK